MSKSKKSNNKDLLLLKSIIGIIINVLLIIAYIYMIRYLNKIEETEKCKSIYPQTRKFMIFLYYVTIVSTSISILLLLFNLFNLL